MCAWCFSNTFRMEFKESPEPGYCHRWFLMVMFLICLIIASPLIGIVLLLTLVICILRTLWRCVRGKGDGVNDILNKTILGELLKEHSF